MIRTKKIKNSDTGITGKNGIKIDGDISFSSDKELGRSNFVLVQFALVFFATICTIYMGSSFLDFDLMNATILIFMALLTTAFLLIKSSVKPLKYLGSAYVVLHTLFMIPLYGDIRDGFFIIINRYLYLANQTSSFYGEYIESIRHVDYDFYATHFFIFLGTIIVTVLAIACIARIDFPLMFIITFPVFELGMYWGWEPKTWTVIGLLICWVTLLTLHIINHTTNKAGKNNTFAVHNRKKSYYFTSDTIKNKFFTIYARSIALLCAGVFFTTIIFSSVTGFVRPKSFDPFRKDISQAVDDFSFNKLKNALDDYEGGLNLFSIKTVGGTNGGVLGQASSISFNGSSALKVRTVTPTDAMYLRGYVAGNYDDNSWKEIDFEDDTDYLDMFDEYAIYVQDYNYKMNELRINNYPDSSFGTIQEISVSVLGASKRFVYAPYMAYYASDRNTGDEKLEPTDESYVNLESKKYTLDYYDMSSLYDTWNDVADQMMYDYISPNELTSSYTSFVNRNYMDLHRTDAMQQAYDEIRNSHLTSGNASAFSDVVDSISDYFSDNYKYTLSPGVTPKGEDFIDYFLTNQKEGYCSYFATAGVMLMREFGYPARYVEGYIVLPSEFEGDGDVKTATVKDKAAHAWCEVYLDNIGWVPCEFTPGYQNNNPNLKESEKKPQTTTTKVTTSKKDSSQSEPDNSSKSSNTSKTTTTKKSVTSSSLSSAGGSGGGVKPNDEKKSTEIYSILIYALGLAAIVFAVVMRRKHNIHKMNKLINSENNNAVRSAYRYYLKYLSLISVTSDKNITDMQLAKEIMKQCREREINGLEKDLTKLSTIAVKSYLSNSKITDKEAEFARGALARLSKTTVKKQLSPLGKFSAKWIYNLY